MKKLIPILILLLMVTCTPEEADKGLLGTWQYTVKDAPFGFQTGKVIFFEEDTVTRVKLKVYGISMKCDTLIIEGNKVSFTTKVEHEDVSILLEMKDKKLIGMVHASEGGMPIEIVRKGRKNRDKKDRSGKISSRFRKGELSTGRVHLKQVPETTDADHKVNYKVHTFYYGWYGNPASDGAYSAWNHAVLPHWIDSTWNQAGSYPGGDDIGANFYPQLGDYSSMDPEVISLHMQQIRDAGIGVVAISWWGQAHRTDKSVAILLDTAQQYGLKLAFHIEPIYHSVSEFRTQLAYLGANYLQHPAIYKINNKPLYYLYNSFQLQHDEWQSLLHPDSGSTLRGTQLDGIFIGLWTTGFDGEFMVKSGFDGFYTYFASDGFAYGSTTTNWPEMSAFARKHNLIYIPCVGPGYEDTRIRPWNETTTRSREQGRYYEKMYATAVHTNADFIGITSFNEWHEGTQIEPAVPKAIPSFTYEDYGIDTDPGFYLRKTKELIHTHPF